ncbi:hypothetical protein AQUCO_01000506v1 [Aquilegia coerulea]|uniref:GATA-type domain-containing protein n=1 Tax=Aquilegia coerulea TaxID=218851 RepID=A0A2G5EAB0_AQUCA|nr:hypothetical protein AQUCO_01000506v1 [Aquilegia coerulea]
MHRCSSSHGNSYNPCSSCGFYQAPSNSFSMFFSMPNHQQQQQQQFDHDQVDAYTITPSSSVDCTLSLGTPSTRQTNYNFMDHHHQHSSNISSSSSSGSKKLSWDIFQTKKPSSSGSTAHKSNRGGSNGQDPLLARRCANCDTTSTPLWRNGPRGPKSLCNACGIRYKKEEKRAATSATSTATASSTIMDPHHYMGHHHMNSWVHQGNEFRFIEDNDNDSADNGIPFLSWRLNVPADRASLVHDYS